MSKDAKRTLWWFLACAIMGLDWAMMSEPHPKWISLLAMFLCGILLGIEL